MKKITLLAVLFSGYFAYTQDSELENLKQQLKKTRTDLEKVSALRSLMQYYNGYGKNDSAKYFFNEITNLADQSSEAAVKIEALLCNGLYWHENRGTERKDKFTNSQPYFKQALELAKSSKDRVRESWAHFSLSFSWQNAPYDKDNKCLDEAEKGLNIALEHSTDDSLFIYSYLRVAIAYQIQGNYEQAFMNLDKALIKAIETGNPIRLRAVYNYFMLLYKALNDPVKELEYIDKMAAITKEHYRVDWEIEDLRLKGFFIRNQALGSFNYKQMLSLDSRVNSSNREAIERSTTMLFKAFNVLKATRVGINWKNVPLFDNLYFNYFWSNEAQKITELKNIDPVLTKVWERNWGRGICNFKAAELYLENEIDSAIQYLESCGRINFDGYRIYFLAKVKKGNKDSIISLLEKSKLFYKNAVDEVQSILICLDSLYREKGDYQRSAACLQEYIHLKDSTDQATSSRNIWLLQVNNAEKVIQIQKEMEKRAINRRHSLQYIGMVVGIVTVFILLALFGLFRVSSLTIRVLGFFSFLLFFEFLFLLFKKYLKPITHEEPIRELIFMIVLAAVLIPLHHWLEHKVFHYLTSNKMFIPKRNGWMKNIFNKQRLSTEELKES